MRRFILLFSLVPFLAGCFCKQYTTGNSSVRFLTSFHRYTLCYDMHGDGKKVLATAYTTDPLFEKIKFDKNEAIAPITGITFTNQGLFGARMESFFKLGAYPGPLLGVGLDYSHSKFTGAYNSAGNKTIQYHMQTVNRERLNLSLNLVTWIRARMLGYITLQPGGEWTKRKLVSDFPQYNFTDRHYTGKMNYRIGYGFHFYLLPTVEFNFELGYGAGAFVRGGVGVWVF